MNTYQGTYMWSVRVHGDYHMIIAAYAGNPSMSKQRRCPPFLSPPPPHAYKLYLCITVASTSLVCTGGTVYAHVYREC